MSLKDVRRAFPVLADAAYLNAGSFGPVPRVSEEALVRCHRDELARGRSSPTYFARLRAARSAVRAELAALIGATEGEVALTRSTTEGCNVVVAGLGLEPGDEVVTTDMEHYGLLGALGASPATVRVANLLDAPPAEASARVAAEVGPRTRLIALSHVSWFTGEVLPAAEIATIGPPVLLDGAQSVGAVPVEVGELGCAFLAFPGQKWLIGPDGTGGLYVAPEWLDRVDVRFPSYYGQAGYEQDGTATPADGSPRFDTGTIPAASVAGLLASLRFASNLGDVRFQRAQELTSRCATILERIVRLHRPGGGGTLVAFQPDEPAESVVARLAATGVVVRELPSLGWVRASIGFWTNEDDLQRLANALLA